MTGIYDLVRPTRYAGPPDLFSFSSLSAIEACPRRWQFLASSWGEYERYPERPHPTALEGRIVHEGIELLIREVGRRGMPSIGTPRFRDAVEASGFFEHFASEVDAWNERLARHPRGGPEFVLRTAPRQLANRAIRLFRAQYVPRDEAVAAHGSDVAASVAASAGSAEDFDPSTALRTRGALTEVRLRHPRLPFVGVLDLVRQTGEGIRIVDFKTGQLREGHIEQVLLYALLWWRIDGEAPTFVSLQYQDRTVDREIERSSLEGVESRLAERIAVAKAATTDMPAGAVTGTQCSYCPVRAKCDQGWDSCCSAPALSPGDFVDIEVVLIGNAGPSGFVAASAARTVDVVYGPSQGRHVRRLRSGDRCRITRGLVGMHGEIELKAWTEVHLVHGTGDDGLERYSDGA